MTFSDLDATSPSRARCRAPWAAARLPAATSASKRFSLLERHAGVHDDVGRPSLRGRQHDLPHGLRGQRGQPGAVRDRRRARIVLRRGAEPDRFYYEVVPPAPSYTLTLPMDIAARVPRQRQRQRRPDAHRGQPAGPLRAAGAVRGDRRSAARTDAHGRRRAVLDRFVDVASTAGYFAVAPTTTACSTGRRPSACASTCRWRCVDERHAAVGPARRCATRTLAARPCRRATLSVPAGGRDQPLHAGSGHRHDHHRRRVRCRQRAA